MIGELTIQLKKEQAENPAVFSIKKH